MARTTKPKAARPRRTKVQDPVLDRPTPPEYAAEPEASDHRPETEERGGWPAPTTNEGG